MIRRVMMRPAIFTCLFRATSSSALLSPNSARGSPERLSRRKSLGKGLPWARKAASLERRSSHLVVQFESLVDFRGGGLF